MLPRPLRLGAGLAVAALSVPLLTACGTSVQSFEVGDCLLLEDQPNRLTTVPVVSCTEEHDAEVYHVHVFSDGVYPGSTVVADELGAACTEGFESYVGVPYELSEYRVQILTPTSDGWDRADHRAGTCLLHTPGELRTDSGRDSGR